MSNTTENESLVAEIADRLQAGDVPLRGGEQADWSREARSLIAAANPDEPTETLEHLVRNRLAGVPLAYLTRYETFLGDQYAVEPGVVVPHPATELLGLLALQAVDLHAPAGA